MRIGDDNLFEIGCREWGARLAYKCWDANVSLYQVLIHLWLETSTHSRRVRESIILCGYHHFAP